MMDHTVTTQSTMVLTYSSAEERQATGQVILARFEHELFWPILMT